jgi:hypothetical protein
VINPIYAHPILYELALRLLYRSHYHERFSAVAAEIPDDSSVVDLCAGDCALFRHVLIRKNVNYLACDRNELFLSWAQKKGIPTQRIDLITDEIPSADCVVMMGSLYQFIPDEQPIIEKMIRAAHNKVIITEPTRNLADSRYAILRWFAGELTKLGSQTRSHRFNEESLKTTLSQFGFHDFKTIAGGREILACRTV